MVALFYSRRDRMRKTIPIILTLVVLLAACAAPPQVDQSSSPAATNPPEATVEPTAGSVATVEPPQAEATVAEAAPQAVPTSRGDGLVASDPAQVNLNPGRPVLVEFFRFT
jgi:uncharacterized lipoprotein YajG